MHCVSRNCVGISDVSGGIGCLFLFFFFFSSRRRHTRSLCDWSSDVCSSDLTPAARHVGQANVKVFGDLPLDRINRQRDRKSVVKGKSVDLGGRRIIKKKKTKSRRPTAKQMQSKQLVNISVATGA